MAPDDADEHQDGAGHGVKHEFHGGIDAALVSPNADEEIHGDEHDFPEEKKEEEIEREEDTDHADFEHQQHDEEFLDAMLDAIPGREYGNSGQERSQDDEEQADAVQTEMIVNGRDVDPFGEFFELIAGNADLHFRDQEQGEKEFDGGDGHREAANPKVIVGTEQEERETGSGREEDHDGEQIAAVKH